MKSQTAERGGHNDKEAARQIYSAVLEVLGLNPQTTLNNLLSSIESGQMGAERIRNLQELLLEEAKRRSCRFSNTSFFHTSEIAKLSVTGEFDDTTKGLLCFVHQKCVFPRKVWKKLSSDEIKRYVEHQSCARQ
ncbi:hypothetical protein KC865_02070 [Candidatus Kaiserbacteria bacterium]|nr:hypothetical protein [Candidatus Kaiserbacteria bacterium]USN92192.1 MAG: hypothetical protein H6782_04945 [Candidatus Nomurabacteria bacterium]